MTWSHGTKSAELDGKWLSGTSQNNRINMRMPEISLSFMSHIAPFAIQLGRLSHAKG